MTKKIERILKKYAYNHESGIRQDIINAFQLGMQFNYEITTELTEKGDGNATDYIVSYERDNIAGNIPVSSESDKADQEECVSTQEVDRGGE